MNNKQKEIIELMQNEGNVSPQLIIARTSIQSDQNCHYHLKELQRKEKIEKVVSGLYCLAETEEKDEVDQSGFTFLNTSSGGNYE